MENSSPFDGQKYEKLQAGMIADRYAELSSKDEFQKARLYIEIGGKLLKDDHASRVLPGFDPTCKPRIMARLLSLQPRLLLCVSAIDVDKGRTWVTGESYEETLFKLIEDYNVALPSAMAKPDIVVNMLTPCQEPKERVKSLIDNLVGKGLRVWMRYLIPNYPNAPPSAFAKHDDHVVWGDDVKVVIVTAVGSSSGKLSTCLGQIYLDRVRLSLRSSYAKYELFPIFNLAIDHPVQFAYEAATADLDPPDVVEYDKFEEEREGLRPVNYNRDNDAFPLLRRLLESVTPEDEYIRQYYISPTRMGINAAGFCIRDTVACGEAGVAECKRRLQRHKEAGEGDAVKRIEEVLKRAEESLKKLKEAKRNK